MSEFIASLTAAIALALILAATIARSRFAGSSRRFQIAPIAFLLSRRARQAFFEQVPVSDTLASQRTFELLGRRTKTSLDAQVSIGDRSWVMPAPTVRQPFEHMLASNHSHAASGRRSVTRLDLGWPIHDRIERQIGSVWKLLPVRQAPRDWPAIVRAGA